MLTESQFRHQRKIPTCKSFQIMYIHSAEQQKTSNYYEDLIRICHTEWYTGLSTLDFDLER